MFGGLSIYLVACFRGVSKDIKRQRRPAACSDRPLSKRPEPRGKARAAGGRPVRASSTNSWAFVSLCYGPSTRKTCTACARQAHAVSLGGARTPPRTVSNCQALPAYASCHPLPHSVSALRHRLFPELRSVHAEPQARAVMQTFETVSSCHSPAAYARCCTLPSDSYHTHARQAIHDFATTFAAARRCRPSKG